MAHLGDITKLDGGNIPPVHVLTFGSPCQNLSFIGGRDGLAGEKSGLFHQAIRIIREMRCATNGIYPVIRYWGKPPPPQRRKRIFVVADFGGRRAGEILFKPRDLLPAPAPCGDCGNTAPAGNRILIDEAGGPLPVLHPIQERSLRGAAKKKDQQRFINSFGRPDEPFPTLLASGVNMFSFWYEGDPEHGFLRYLTPTESERLMGLAGGLDGLRP